MAKFGGGAKFRNGLVTRGEPTSDFCGAPLAGHVESLVATPLIVNGVTITRTACLVGSDVGVGVGGRWICRTTGTFLPETGAGASPVITPGAGRPGMTKGPLCTANTFRGPNNTFIDGDTRDFFLELLVRNHYGAATDYAVFGKILWVANFHGWQVWFPAAIQNVRLMLYQNSAALNVDGPATGTITEQLLHIVAAGNRDEASVNGCKIWVNGVAGNGVDITSRADVTCAVQAYVCTDTAAGRILNQPLYMLQLFQGAGFIQAGAAGMTEIDTIVKRRLAVLSGCVAGIDAVSPYPVQLPTRTSIAYIESQVE